MDNDRDMAQKIQRSRDTRLLYNKNRARERTNRPIEVDPNGLDAHADGSKLDAGKPDASMLLMFGKALIAVAEISTFGAKKYTRGGWQSVADGFERYTAAELRHMCKEHYEDYDADSGLLHLAHGAWNALARLEMKLRSMDNDNSCATDTCRTTAPADSTPKL